MRRLPERGWREEEEAALKLLPRSQGSRGEAPVGRGGGSWSVGPWLVRCWEVRLLLERRLERALGSRPACSSSAWQGTRMHACRRGWVVH